MTKEQSMEAFIAKRIFPITKKIENGVIADMENALFQMCLAQRIRGQDREVLWPDHVDGAGAADGGIQHRLARAQVLFHAPVSVERGARAVA